MTSNLDTGDIVLFAGVAPSGLLVRCALWTPWSHVGVVYKPTAGAVVAASAEPARARTLCSAVRSNVGVALLLESVRHADDGATVAGACTGGGVRLALLCDRLRRGERCGRIAARRLVFASPEAGRAYRARIEASLLAADGPASLHRLLGTPFETSMADLVRSHFGTAPWWPWCSPLCVALCGDDDEDVAYEATVAHSARQRRSIFCSELVAIVHDDGGALYAATAPPCDMYTPLDFADTRRSELRLRAGVTLGNIRTIRTRGARHCDHRHHSRSGGQFV